LLQEYERREMEFLSSSVSQNRIIITVLPGKYLLSKNYNYTGVSDEYSRYLNDVAQDSPFLFYVETKNTNTGRLNDREMNALLNFIREMNPISIFIGGGYIGRCQEQFHDALTKALPNAPVSVVPELSAISPNDITESTAKMLLTSDKKLNKWALNYFLKNGGLKKFKVNINITNMTNEMDDTPIENGSGGYSP
ncbi:MAG: hypothetical protein ACM34I_05865, partial [bacterium]